MNSKFATLIIQHELDLGSEAILAEVAALASTQVLDSYFLIGVGASTSIEVGDFDANYVTGAGSERCKLLDRLSRVGAIDQLRIVCLNAASEESDEQISSEIAESVIRIKTSLDQLLGASISVSEIRIGVRGFGESIPSINFFPINSNANVLVIPHDRVADGGMARPITRATDGVVDHSFALHGAIELSSLIGLWRSMQHAPVDNFSPSVAGTAVSRLRFSQSRVRLLIGPPLPMDKIAEETEDLPLPLQHFSVSNTEKGATDLVDSVYPSELVFNEGEVPNFNIEVLGGLKALLEFIKEIGRSVFLLPKFIVKGMQGEIDSLASNIYSDALGDDSMVKILGVSSTNAGGSVGLTRNEFEEIIESITQRSTRELVSPISRDHWSSMITKFFGAIDGNPNVRDVRQQLFSNENILLVDRTAAGISDRDLSGEIEKLMFEYVRPEIIVEIPQVEPEIIEIPVVENGSTDGGVAVEENAIPEEPVKIEISVDVEPELIQEVEDVQPKRNSLVELISDRFARERDKARARSEAMVQKIRDLFDDMKAKEALGVSSAVAVAAWCALCSIVFVLATSTPLRKPLSFSSLSGYTRDALWTSFSGIFVVVAVVLLGYGGKKTWQVRALITGGAVGVVLAACLVWFEDIRTAVQTSDGKPVAAVVLAVATIGLLGVAVFRNLNSKSEVRKQLGRVFLLVTSVYLLVSLVLWQCMKNSALQTAESSTRSKLLWAVLIVAGLILLSCLGIVALVQIRERLRLRKNAQILEWCRQELEVSIEAERRLAAAQTQWSATGAVLSRLLTHPLGIMDTSGNELIENLSSDESILKYDVARLMLNEQGAAGLVARLRRHFVEPGWLGRQYEKMVRKFQEQAAFRSGNRIEDLIDRRPEMDPAVNTVERAKSGLASGDRWDFARSVFDGDYDQELGQVPEQLDLEEVYQSVLDNPSSYELVGSQLEGASAREFLEQVLPAPRVDLATGLTKRVFTGSDESRRMTSEVWWPHDILGEPNVNSDEVVVNQSSSLLSSFFAGAVLLVGIRIDFSEPFAYFDCEGAKEAEKKITPTGFGESSQSDF
jgi:hypothetical protein